MPSLLFRSIPLVLLAVGLACGTGQSPSEPEPQSDDQEPGPQRKAKGKRSKAAERDGLALAALTATSGVGVEATIDGDEGTSWKPVQDPDQEGVLLRFERPTDVTKIKVLACDAPKTEVTLFADGREVGSYALASDWKEINSVKGKVRSLFFRLDADEGACIREISVAGNDGAPLPLAPPRSVRGTLSTSSVLQPAVAYRPGYLFDGRTHFGWVEGSSGDGVGEWLEVAFERPQEIKALHLWNGYQRSDDHFQKNGRLKKIRLTVDGQSAELAVADKSGMQVIPVEPPLSGKTARIEVLEVFPGSKYKDLVISELRFEDSARPYTVRTNDLAQAEDEIRSQIQGTPLAKVVGKVYESRCEGVEGTLKLRADGSFIWYGTEETGPDDEVQELLDGAWALKSKKGEWATTEIYARRQRIESTWEPYGGEQRTESTRVSGGSLSIARAQAIGVDKLAAQLNELAGDTAKDRIACIGSDLQSLVAQDAILIKGTALTDVMVPRK